MLIEDVEIRIASLRLQPSLLDRIKQAQLQDPEKESLLKVIGESMKTKLCIDEYGVIRYQTRLWVPGDELRKEVLKEAHSSAYSIHPGSTKMYKDLKKCYW